MKIALIVIQLIPYVLDIVKAAEQAFPLGGKGKEKFDFVLAAVQTVWQEVSQGASLIPWEQIAGPIGKIINLFVAAMNAAGQFQHPSQVKSVGVG